MAKKLADVTSYEEARKFLGGREERTIAHNTRLRDATRNEDGCHFGAIAVRLHATDVVTYTQPGWLILNSGGYRTVTTKERINAFLPIGYGVFAKDFVWFVRIGLWSDDNGKTVPFEDGMTLPANYRDALK